MTLGVRDIFSWLWPSHWMVLVVLFSLISCIVVAFIADQAGFKRFQSIAVWLTCGVVVAFLYFLFTGNWQTALAVFIGFIISALLGVILVCLIAALFSGALYIWERLGGD